MRNRFHKEGEKMSSKIVFALGLAIFSSISLFAAAKEPIALELPKHVSADHPHVKKMKGHHEELGYVTARIELLHEEKQALENSLNPAADKLESVTKHIATFITAKQEIEEAIAAADKIFNTIVVPVLNKVVSSCC